MKGRNDISEEEVKSSYYFNDSSIAFDATMIIGHNAGSANGSLLLCRFNKLSPLLRKKQKQTTNKLLIDLMKELKNNGLERRRTGGSSGLTQYTKELKVMLKTNNISPRCSKGTIYIKSKSNLVSYTFYI